jgi:membrane protein implicated in regulation of membrane protease activity
MRDHPWLPREPTLPAFAPGAAIGGVAALLVLLALADAPGTLLIVLALLAALALGALAVLLEQSTPAVVSVALVATAALGLLGMELGGRAGRSAQQGTPFPAVVGMKVDRARRLFEQHGGVRVVIQRVSYGERNVVLRATGYGPHGTYGPGSTIRLVVGTRPPR